MINLMIHTPVNTRGRLTNYVKEFVPKLQKELNQDIVITSPHDFEKRCESKDNWIENCIRDNNLPDMVLTHASEFSVLYGKDFKQYFSPMSGAYSKKIAVRKELQPFVDVDSVFFPLFVVPMVMGYNSKTVNEKSLEGSWLDLFNPAFKAVLPATGKPITKVVGAHILKHHPERFHDFENLTYLSGPQQAIRSVFEQVHDILVTNTAFIIAGKEKGLKINPTKEGVMVLPQVIAFKKGADERLLKVIDYLMEREIQSYLGENGFFPAAEGATMGETIFLDKKIREFTSWEQYIQEIHAYNLKVEGE